jgi:predicted transposase YbfD/YdcC
VPPSIPGSCWIAETEVAYPPHHCSLSGRPTSNCKSSCTAQMRSSGWPTAEAISTSTVATRTSTTDVLCVSANSAKGKRKQAADGHSVSLFSRLYSRPPTRWSIRVLLHCICRLVALSCPERVRRNVRSRRRKQTYEPSAGLRFLTLSGRSLCDAAPAILTPPEREDRLLAAWYRSVQ